ncbi:M20 family metallo-hydrolase [Yanshouia hominis]|uniref:M20 family metallo-hydrolase n=1 Tax=Yanshouia hominis TaxID=2763673 RepID=A0ABR7NGZ0_9FIRM|nr:M20 family metallo-hydrolase [Yanshouia hominis]MBC8575674.1 M20 family metallo-hydrolase [Yanshouia hominis]
MADVKRIEKDIEALYQISAPCEEGCTRLSYTPAYREAVEYLKSRMAEFGMQVREDRIGTLYGVVKGSNPAAPGIVSGSHLDTVRCAGAFDGLAGIVCSLEAARMLVESGVPMESDFEVVATIMEDGGRYPGTTGSRFMVGIYGEPDLHRLTDDDGILLIDAMREYGLPGNIEGVCRRPEEAKAFLELHMEQATRLQSSHTDIGVVRTICGNAWFRLTARGRASHPAIPHAERSDAGLASIRLLSRLEDKIAADYNGRITVNCGQMELKPGAVNAVPSRAVFTVDFRSFEQSCLDAMSAFLREEALRIEREYRVSFEVQFLKGSAPVENSPNIIDAFERAAARLGYTSMPLNSGAGHDTMFLRRIWDAGLIFIPSYNGGVTHCPEEFTDYANLAKGADVLLETARIIDREKK